MKLQLQREALLKPLQLAIGVVGRKQTIPILSNILLDIKGNKLSITGTDLEVELIGQTCLEQSATTNSSLTLPGRKLIDICRALPENAAIELYQDKDRVVLRSGRSRFTLATLPSGDFPNTEEYQSQLSFDITQRELLYLLQRTYFAMAQQDVRYYLNGMLLEVCSDTLRSVATDGHRLATTIINIPTQSAHRIQIIIPYKGVLELMRLLNDVEDSVTLIIGNNHIRVAGDQFTFTSKLIEGRFPEYDRAIPKSSGQFIKIDRDELKNALSRTAILCDEKFHSICIELKPGLLRIFANNTEQEAAEEELPVEYTKEDLEIGFNVTYLLDVLNIIKPGEVTLNFSGSNSSVMVKEADSIFVVMPMHL